MVSLIASGLAVPLLSFGFKIDYIGRFKQIPYTHIDTLTRSRCLEAARELFDESSLIFFLAGHLTSPIIAALCAASSLRSTLPGVAGWRGPIRGSPNSLTMY